MTKQGYSWRSWRKRYFVLKGNNLYYFKSQTDTEATGVVVLTPESYARKVPDKKGRYMFGIKTNPRLYLMYPESEAERTEWIAQLEETIDRIKGVDKTKGNTIVKKDDVANGKPAKGDGDIRKYLLKIRSEVTFLESEESKVFEFFKIWTESIPTRQELSHQSTITYDLCLSGDMEKLSWKVSGPQYLFIQKMVDFFWNVGAPDTEIDRLNEIGSLINPLVIGSWVDMSAKGGMDGGWFFPGQFPLSTCSQAADSGYAVQKITDWAEQCGIEHCGSIGRDMGAAPPRQTEFRFQIQGDTLSKQLDYALAAFTEFSFPPIPEEALDLLRQIQPKKIQITVVTCASGFVRLGLLASNPPKQVVESLCNLSGGNFEQLCRFESVIEANGPDVVEFQYLNEGFGYGVYKEGFDIIFHYNLGEEEEEKLYHT